MCSLPASYSSRVLLVFLTILLVSACQPADQPTLVLPTLASLPSVTPTESASATLSDTAAPSDTATLRPSRTPRNTSTPTPSRTPTLTPTATQTPTITLTPSNTPNPTSALIASGTAAVEEAPRFSTFTPVPPGAPTAVLTTPQVIADVIITERQFQEEVNLRLASYSSMQRALVDFTPGVIAVQLTALGGEAFITGNVQVRVQATGRFATISLGEIIVNAAEVPPAYADTVTGDFFIMITDSLNAILEQRLGQDQNLENIELTDTQMEITLLVPPPA